jgi:hypothetical protein
MADNFLVKKGKFGRPKVPLEMPDAVWERIDELTYDEDTDWQLFSDKAQQLWIVVKCWEDETRFDLVAAKVEYQSQPIENGVKTESWQSKVTKNSGTYYDIFER